MSPLVKKIIAVAVLLVLVNVGFAWYGQANYEATLKSLGKAFVENNVTASSSPDIPPAIRRFTRFANPSGLSYRAIALQFDGDYRIKPDKAMKMHSLALLRPTPDMLWGVRLDPNPLVTFNAIETYHSGRAAMQTLLFGIIPTGKFDDRPFARSELARLLAYGLFNPALLDRDCVRYKALDKEHTAATITDGNLTASVTFASDADGKIVEVTSNDRMRSVKKRLYPARWRMRILSYRKSDGLNLPGKVEESWIDHGAVLTYTRYRLSSAKRL